MSKVTDDLKAIVEKVAREGALTPAAIKQFDEISMRLETAEAELKTTKERLTAETERRHTTSTELATASTALAEANKALATYRTREFELTVQARLYEHMVYSRQEMRGILADAFKNFELSREFTKSVPLPPSYSGGPPNQGFETHTETERQRPDTGYPR